MGKNEILPGIYSVGVADWNVRTFHGATYSTRRGTSYNAYLIIDDKVTLIDTVHGRFSDEFIRRINEIIPVEKIDYIIANHVEADHSGSLPALLNRCPHARIYGTDKCREGLISNYHLPLNFQAVKTGDTLDIGARTLQFIEAAMIHWPDSMFTYCARDQVLFPNDAFGQHLASTKLFDDEADQCVLMDEAAKYYANILWPLSSLIAKKIEELQKMKIGLKMIAPSHGIIWRKQPQQIVKAYSSWARSETKPKIIVAYESMWGTTAHMAREIVRGIAEAGIEAKLYDLAVSDRTDIIADMLDAPGFIFGSSTHDNGMLPIMASFLHFLKGLRPQGRSACVFGSYGWGGGAVKEIEESLQRTGIKIAQPSCSVRYVPDTPTVSRIREFGKGFAVQIKEAF